MEKLRTDTHEFSVFFDKAYGSHIAQFRPINIKTGKLWQAFHRIEDGADVTPEGWDRPIAFSTAEAAWTAVGRKKEQLARRR